MTAARRVRSERRRQLRGGAGPGRAESPHWLPSGTDRHIAEQAGISSAGRAPPKCYQAQSAPPPLRNTSRAPAPLAASARRTSKGSARSIPNAEAVLILTRAPSLRKLGSIAATCAGFVRAKLGSRPRTRSAGTTGCWPRSAGRGRGSRAQCARAASHGNADAAEQWRLGGPCLPCIKKCLWVGLRRGARPPPGTTIAFGASNAVFIMLYHARDPTLDHVSAGGGEAQPSRSCHAAARARLASAERSAVAG